MTSAILSLITLKRIAARTPSAIVYTGYDTKTVEVELTQSVYVGTIFL